MLRLPHYVYTPQHGVGEMGSVKGDDESLAELFWGVGRTLRHTAREALAGWDLAPSQARALGVLAADGPIRLGELAERLRIAPRSATEVVDQLESRELARREPDPADRRATRVDVTVAGRTMAESIRKARAGQAELIFEGLASADRRELRRLLLLLREVDH